MDAVLSALSDYPEFVPVVARWHWQEWGHAGPGGTLQSWTAGLARQAGADQIPGTVIAVAHGIPLGGCLPGRPRHARTCRGRRAVPLGQGPVRRPVGPPPGLRDAADVAMRE